jgi:hypothetical protein
MYVDGVVRAKAACARRSLLRPGSHSCAGGYWEGELVVPGVSEKVGLVVPASETGPSEEQAAFCRRLLADLDALFARCRPVFEGDFEL